MSTESILLLNYASTHLSAPLWYFFPKLTSSDCDLLWNSKCYFCGLATQCWSPKCCCGFGRPHSLSRSNTGRWALHSQEAQRPQQRVGKMRLLNWVWGWGLQVRTFSTGCLRGAFPSCLTKSEENFSPQSSLSGQEPAGNRALLPEGCTHVPHPQGSLQPLPGLTPFRMPRLGGKYASESSSHMNLKFLLGFSNRPCLYNWFVCYHREQNQRRKTPLFLSTELRPHLHVSFFLGFFLCFQMGLPYCALKEKARPKSSSSSPSYSLEDSLFLPVEIIKGKQEGSGRKELGMTERLNWTEEGTGRSSLHNFDFFEILFHNPLKCSRKLSLTNRPQRPSLPPTSLTPRTIKMLSSYAARIRIQGGKL